VRSVPYEAPPTHSRGIIIREGTTGSSSTPVTCMKKEAPASVKKEAPTRVKKEVPPADMSQTYL
jgi:hypothetical protein